MYAYNDLLFPSHNDINTRFFALVGFSFNGPVGKPFLIKEKTDPYKVLGNCALTENYLIAKSKGVTPIILRLNGAHAESTLVHEELNVPIIHFTSIEASENCNSIRIFLKPTTLTIKGMFNTYTYSFSRYSNIRELVNAINNDLYYAKGEVKAKVLTDASLTGLVVTEKTLTFSGGDTGSGVISRLDGYDTQEKINNQITLLEQHFLDKDGEEVVGFTGEFSHYHIDTLLFTDIPYEKAPVALSKTLGLFAQLKTEEQKLFCSVVLASYAFGRNRYSPEKVDLFAPQISSLLAINPLQESNDHLKHVEVVVGMQHSIGSQLTIPCAASYAIMRYNLEGYYVSGTNKAISSLNFTFNQELTQDEVANLSSSGYICIVPNIKKGFVAYSSQNLFPYEHFQRKPHYLRTLHYDVRSLLTSLNPYIGESFYLESVQDVLKALDTEVALLTERNPLYKQVSMEVKEAGYSHMVIVFYFDLYGEIERVRTSLEYVPQKEVSIAWE